MGISGLLPLLKSIQVTTHVKQYAGKVVGVDGYVWLHKGAFSCAWDLALGNHTTKY
jgi:exonuclease 1